MDKASGSGECAFSGSNNLTKKVRNCLLTALAQLGEITTISVEP